MKLRGNGAKKLTEGGASMRRREKNVRKIEEMSPCRSKTDWLHMKRDWLEWKS